MVETNNAWDNKEWGQSKGNNWLDDYLEEGQSMTPFEEEEGALGWDDEISEEPSFVLLDPGIYKFTVTGLTRGRFEGSEKMSPCNKATLELTIKHADKEAKIKSDLFLHKKSEWKLSQFFICIGQKKEGEPLRMNWQKVPGAEGYCEVIYNEHKGKTYNRVGNFLTEKEVVQRQKQAKRD